MKSAIATGASSELGAAIATAGMSGPIHAANPQARAVRSQGVPLRRLGTAEDIANAVMFLASRGASHLNGQELLVDGGVAHSAIALLPRA